MLSRHLLLLTQHYHLSLIVLSTLRLTLASSPLFGLILYSILSSLYSLSTPLIANLLRHIVSINFPEFDDSLDLVKTELTPTHTRGTFYLTAGRYALQNETKHT